MDIALGSLTPGLVVKARHPITPERAKQWRHAAQNGVLPGTLATGARLKVVSVSTVPPLVKLQLPGRSPPAFIVLTGTEFAHLFDLDGVAAVKPAAPPAKDLGMVYQRLVQQQKIVREGVAAYGEAKAALKRDIDDARFWGNAAVFANAAMLPLNIVISGFQAKGAVTAYKAVVKALFDQFGKSGTRIDSKPMKTGLAAVKRAVVEALKAQGYSQYVPGANILVGFAEDSVALFETASMVSDGSKEMRQLMRQMEAKLAEAESAYLRIGVEMERVMAEIDRRRRTA